MKIKKIEWLNIENYKTMRQRQIKDKTNRNKRNKKNCHMNSKNMSFVPSIFDFIPESKR